MIFQHDKLHYWMLLSPPALRGKFLLGILWTYDQGQGVLPEVPLAQSFVAFSMHCKAPVSADIKKVTINIFTKMLRE